MLQDPGFVQYGTTPCIGRKFEKRKFENEMEKKSHTFKEKFYHLSNKRKVLALTAALLRNQSSWSDGKKEIDLDRQKVVMDLKGNAVKLVEPEQPPYH